MESLAWRNTRRQKRLRKVGGGKELAGQLTMGWTRNELVPKMGGKKSLPAKGLKNVRQQGSTPQKKGGPQTEKPEGLGKVAGFSGSAQFCKRAQSRETGVYVEPIDKSPSTNHWVQKIE